MLALFGVLVAGILANCFWIIGWEYLRDPAVGLLLSISASDYEGNQPQNSTF